MGIPQSFIGLTPPPTLWKIRCGFRLHRRLWELLIEFVHTLPLSIIRVNTVKTPKSNAELWIFSTLCTNVFYIWTFRRGYWAAVCLSRRLLGLINPNGSFLSSFWKQKLLTSGHNGASMTSTFLNAKCVWAERVVGTKVAESCRMVQGNNRESDEVHSVSSVLKSLVGTTGATVTSLRLFRPCGLPPGCEVNKTYSVRNVWSRVVPRILRPCILIQGFFYLYFPPIYGR